MEDDWLLSKSKIPKLKAYKVDREKMHPETIAVLAKAGFNPNTDTFMCLGEVENINHFCFFRLKDGKMLPGMWHLDEFKRVDPDVDL